MNAGRKRKRFDFPIKIVSGKEWCCAAEMGIKRLEIVAYHIDRKEKFTFAGGHRHRLCTAHDDIHLFFPMGGETLDISGVAPAPPAPARRHGNRN